MEFALVTHDYDWAVRISSPVAFPFYFDLRPVFARLIHFNRKFRKMSSVTGIKSIYMRLTQVHAQVLHLV